MGKGRLRRRQALLALISAAAHLLLLALVIRAVPPPHIPLLNDSERAVQVTLLARARQFAGPTPPRPPSKAPRPPSPRPVHLPPIQRALPASAPPPIAAAPPSPQPTGAITGPPAGNSAQAEQAWARLGRAILGHTGCANPEAAGLNAAERAACQDRVAQSLARAKPLPLGISPRKQAAFDRIESCQEKYDRGTMPAGTDESQGSRIHGLGYIPKAHECAPLGH